MFEKPAGLLVYIKLSHVFHHTMKPQNSYFNFYIIMIINQLSIII